jgi:endonuclease/exonuclease/phosphatase (EEP) superfamily protein YafD
MNLMPADAESRGHQRYRVGEAGQTTPSDPRGHQRYTVPGATNDPASPPSSWRRGALLALNGLIATYALGLLILAVVVWTAPISWWPVCLFLYGPRWLLAAPMLVLVPASLALGAWRSRCIRLAILGLSAWVLLVPILGLCVPWRAWLNGSGTGARLRVLSANAGGSLVDQDRLLKLIEQFKPDLVLLQEGGTVLDQTQKAIGPHWEVRIQNGLLVASRFPIRSGTAIDLSDSGLRAEADSFRIEPRPGWTFPMLNVHLVSPRVGLEALLTTESGRVGIFRQICESQWMASDLVARDRVGDPALLVAGDLNLTVEHPAYRRYWSHLQNAQDQAGWWFGWTRYTRTIGARIDHVLAGPSWRAVSCRVGPDIGSDHLPVLAELEWVGGPNAPPLNPSAGPSDPVLGSFRPEPTTTRPAVPLELGDAMGLPRFVAIPTPPFPGAHAIWGATGRDSRGRVWLGVSALDQLHKPPSAHLMSLVPGTGQITDHGDVLGQLARLGLLRPGEWQTKIHSRIVSGPDDHLYFASGDEAGAAHDGRRNPTWGGHLWRIHPDRPNAWEHLARTPESLIAVAAGGRSIYALGYFGHVLFQYHAPSRRVRSVRVGAVSAHISRNFLTDARGHAYVPRLRYSTGTPARLVSSLVEFDEDLNEIGETELPIDTYLRKSPEKTHGITGVQPLRDGSIVFVTHVGHLYQVRPRTSGPAEVRSLGWMHPDGPCRIESLFSPDGQRYLAAMPVEEPDPAKSNRWIARDLEEGRAVALALDVGIENIAADASRTVALGAAKSLQLEHLLYGSMTRDDEGNAYLVGVGKGGPLLVQVRWADTPPPYPVLPQLPEVAAAAVPAPAPAPPAPATTAPPTAPTLGPVVAAPTAPEPSAAPRSETPLDFHRAVRACLDQARGGSAGHAVHELVKARIGDEGRKMAVAALANLVRRSSALDRRARVRALRSAGLSEPEVLEALAAHEARSIGARNGPRNVEEAYVRAAQGLLESTPTAIGSP